MIDILKFDNSYSWARSKEVFYSVKLLAPTVEPHPRRCSLPVLHFDVERDQQKEVESLLWISCSSHNSSEDEFFDCVQEQEIAQEPNLQICPESISLNCQATVSPYLQKETVPVIPHLCEATLHCTVCCRLDNSGACDHMPDKSRTFHRSQSRQIITGTSVSTQV